MALSLATGPALLRCFDDLESKRTYSRVELVERRLQRLVASPSGFFRGTPALFYALAKRHADARALLGRDRRWIVGDVHMENIGAIAIGHGKLVYDFNDLDEAIVAAPVLDVLRGATSAAIASMDLKLGARAAIRAAEAFVVSYIRPLAEPVPRPVQAMMDHVGTRTTAQLLDERCPVQNGSRRFLLGKRYLPLTPEEKRVVEALFDAYARLDPLPWLTKKLRLEDAAFRVQGTGSLGVQRYIFLAREGKKGEQMLIEAKEMRKSAVDRGGLFESKAYPGGEAARVAKAIAALLAEPQVGVRALRGADKRSYLVRLHAPGEDKLALDSLRDDEELLALARMIGFRLSQAHDRSGGRPPPSLDASRVLSVALDLSSAIGRTHQALTIRASSLGGA